METEWEKETQTEQWKDEKIMRGGEKKKEKEVTRER